jgi:hypothetical protein
MSRRAEWQQVLDAQVANWSGMSCEQLITELHEIRAYQVEVESKRYQVEVQLLENTKNYVHVIVAIDDGTLPRSIAPLTHGFIRQKLEANHASPSQPSAGGDLTEHP